MDRLIDFFQANLLLSLALLGLTLALVFTEVARLFRGFKGISPSQTPKASCWPRPRKSPWSWSAPPASPPPAWPRAW